MVKILEQQQDIFSTPSEQNFQFSQDWFGQLFFGTMRMQIYINGDRFNARRLSAENEDFFNALKMSASKKALTRSNRVEIQASKNFIL